MKYKTIILSDIHLGSKSSRANDVIEFLENKPKTDNEFHLTINLKNEITIESTSLKSKCKKAWDFTKLTFQRLPII